MRFNLLYITAAAACFAVLEGCGNDPLTSNSPLQSYDNEIQSDNQSNMYFDRIADFGFDKSLMKDAGNLVIYDGDIAFKKADFESSPRLGKSAQRYGAQLISSSNTGNIRLMIHSSMSNWTSVITSAVSAWNTSGHSSIHIEIVTSSPELTIYDDSDSACPAGFKFLPSDICGLGAFPADNNVGTTISINKDAGFFPSNEQKIYLITHKIGHTLGLAHTNEISGNFIVTTLASDNESLMLGNDCGASKTLGMYDKKALSCLYPAPGSLALVRYFNFALCDHFYTRGTNEIGLGAEGYRFESVEGIVFESPTDYSTAPLYRFYHAGLTDHFYSTNYDEGINSGFNYEGIVGYVSTSAQANYLPLYQYWNSIHGDHFYTTNPSEKDGAWVYEKIACYIYNAF